MNQNAPPISSNQTNTQDPTPIFKPQVMLLRMSQNLFQFL